MRFTYEQRLGLFALAALGGFLLLAGRLVDLQILNHDSYIEIARQKATLRRDVPGFRGKIIDADDRVLAIDAPAFDLMVKVGEYRGRRHECRVCRWSPFLTVAPGTLDFRLPAVCRRCRRSDNGWAKSHGGERLFRYADQRDLRPLAAALGTTADELEERLERQARRVEKIIGSILKTGGYTDSSYRREKRRLENDYYDRLRPVERNVSFDVVRAVELHRELGPFLYIRTVQNRLYPADRDFVHLVGRMGWVTEPDEKDPKKKTSRLAGVDGLEYWFDATLRGTPGELLIRRGSRERVQMRDAVHGKTIRLTISSGVQRLALDALSNTTGAFIVVNSRTGAVLAMASTPSYEPGDYAELLREFTPEEGRPARRDKHRSPLVERTCREHYAPGSILKPVTALAGLLAGQGEPSERIRCDGYFYIQGRRQDYLRCHRQHGEPNLREALSRSCNIYFQTYFLRAGCFEEYVRVGRRLGLGQPTGIEIERRYLLGWFPAELEKWRSELRMVAATGQGNIMASPAQMARLYAGLATGRLPRLHFVAAIGEKQIRPPAARLEFDDDAMETIREGLGATSGPEGTARGYGLARWRVSCKTATAVLRAKGDPSSWRIYNAWMAGFAPAQSGRPPIAFAMVVLRTPDGGSKACAPRLAGFFRRFYQALEGTD